MSLKIPLTSVGGSLLACSAVAYGGSCTPAAAQAADQEKILALCETKPFASTRSMEKHGCGLMIARTMPQSLQPFGTVTKFGAISGAAMALCLRYGDATLGMELKVWREG